MSASPSQAVDRRYGRQVLPRVSRTFAINIRVLRGSMREAVQTAYLLCRVADTLEDSWPGSPAAIRERFQRFLEAMSGDDRAADWLAAEAAGVGADRADLELVRHFPAVWRVYQGLSPGDRVAIGDALRVMGSGMSRYAARAAERNSDAPYLDDASELDDYCWVVAGCVGVMLTRLQSSRTPPAPDRAERWKSIAPVVGSALQLTNILLDWPRDVRRGRCFVPAAWLAERGLRPADLVGRSSPDARDLSQRLEARARAALARVPDYVADIPRGAGRYRLFVLLPALWALRSLEAARRDPEFPWGETRPKLSRGELWRAAGKALLGRAPLDELRRAATPTADRAPGR